MSNEIKAHRLIVTLPNTSGEEADTVASLVERDLRDDRAFYGIAPTVQNTVTHALGESLPEHLVFHHQLHDDLIGVRDVDHDTLFVLTAYEARQLAGALLAIEGVADAEPPRPNTDYADALAARYPNHPHATKQA